MGSWDNVNSWKSTIGSLKSEYDVQINETRQLAARMEAQSVKLQVTADDTFKKRDVLMDTAYEALDQFVNDLLKYPGGDAEIGSDGVPSLPTVVGCFKALAGFCERVVVDEGLEAVEAIQEIGEDSQIVQRISSLQSRLQSDLGGLSKMVADAQSYFDIYHGHHENARDALRRAEERRSEFVYSMFGDNEIDRAIQDCQNNETTWRHHADEAWSMWDQLRNLNNDSQSMLNNDVGQLSSQLSSIADRMRTNYNKIGEDRRADRLCWMAARSLQYHVSTNTEYTSRDDALRHVFKLVHTENKTIDSDSDVAALKERIENSVRDKLGTEKAEELHKAKVFLAMPEDVDLYLSQ
ncbi:hypothetical protein EJ02DRAFT_451714 [Clathrospora elynae]|uniref:Uncharacterized protein n=1 Tax=Clathrospora elynae TaxID=706981 RepID=A0A6A5SZ29_9PLEO|nr:hypothetical protein EJ02DRAFT_451714 [Clathrospora elynae]